MVAKVEDQTARTQATECQCREQIADILKRLEALEKYALSSGPLLEEPTDSQEGKSLTEAVWEAYQKSFEQYPDDESLEAALKSGEIKSLRSFRGNVPTQGAEE